MKENYTIENEVFSAKFKQDKSFKVPENYFDELPLIINSKVIVKDKSFTWMVFGSSVTIASLILFFVIYPNQNTSTNSLSVDNSIGIKYLEEYVEEEISQEEVIEYYIDENQKSENSENETNESELYY